MRISWVAVIIMILSTVLNAEYSIEINLTLQKLFLYDNNQIVKSYPISSGINGTGEDNFQTPLGRFRICNKIGDNVPVGTIFKGGVNTRNITSIHKKKVAVEEQKDFIITRILQLDGLESHNKKTFHRGVWIHGTPYEGNIGKPISHGCIRMKNQDIIDLFSKITTETSVYIYV